MEKQNPQVCAETHAYDFHNRDISHFIIEAIPCYVEKSRFYVSETPTEISIRSGVKLSIKSPEMLASSLDHGFSTHGYFLRVDEFEGKMYWVVLVMCAAKPAEVAGVFLYADRTEETGGVAMLKDWEVCGVFVEIN